MGYSAIAEIGDSSGSRNLRTVKLLALNEVRRAMARDFFINIYVISKEDEVKVTSEVRHADALEVRGVMLSRISDKALKKLSLMRKPVGIPMLEVISRLTRGLSIEGLMKLLSYYQRGEFEIFAGSGATRIHELLHPEIYLAILADLGLTEIHALEAVFENPQRIFKGGVNG